MIGMYCVHMDTVYELRASRTMLQAVLTFLAFTAAAAACLTAAQAASYPDCPGVQEDWLPECWIAVHARIQIGGDRMFYWTPHTSKRWGNSLSPYWQARALALLAGHGFDAYAGFENFWLKHLPKQVAPSTCPQLQQFEAACNQCDSESWAYAHRCGAWARIRPTIMNDTHAAFAAWATERKLQLPQFEPDAVVIQSRCSPDTILKHAEYGPVAFSFYGSISSAAKSIVIVTELRNRSQLCADIHAALVKWLKAKFPAADIQVSGGSLHQDFAKLLLAPVLYKDAQSSFGLWAAVANKGEVWSVPLLSVFTNNTQPDLGPKWHWVDAPVLYPRVAAALNITLDKPDDIVKWLETN